MIDSHDFVQTPKNQKTKTTYTIFLSSNSKQKWEQRKKVQNSKLKNRNDLKCKGKMEMMVG